MSGNYWVIAMITILGITLLSMGWRGANRLFQWLIAIWATLLLLSSLAIVVSDPQIKIIAETLHMELPYAFVVLPFDVLFFTLTLVWLIKYRKTNREYTIPRWH